MRDKDAWWFMFFYSVTFSGFVGLASSLTLYFNDQYGLSPVTASYYTAACVFAGSVMRPLGGIVADRIGGIRSLSMMYLVAALAVGVVSIGLPYAGLALAVFVLAMLALGMGNGAVFQLVPQRFRKEIGVMTGLVGLLLFGCLALVALVGLTAVKARWRTTWGAAHVAMAKV